MKCRWARRLPSFGNGRRHEDGKKLEAVIRGGSSAPVFQADIMMSLNMDYDSIAKAGSMLGSGTIIA